MSRRENDARKIAAYLRVSSKSQRAALKSQEPDLKRFVASQEQSAAWYRDTFTGKTMNRPGMDKLLEDARAGKIAKIVVWRLDRLGRTTLGLLQLLQELRALGVGLHSIRDGFDLDTPTGRMVFTILASVAEYETEVRRERQAVGIERALADVAAGKRDHWGGGKAGRRVKVTEEKEATVRREADRGTPIAEIARVVGLTRRTVYKTLEREPVAAAE
jgi:DNA invertase Pin-like site-specific DNA recombinase